MSGINKVIILGRLGRDPEIRMTKAGQPVCSLNIATSDSKDKVEWHKVILWDKQAEIAHKYLKKGRQVYIEGKIQTRSWEDKQGQKVYVTEIMGHNLTFIDSGDKEEKSSPPIETEMEDVPF